MFNTCIKDTFRFFFTHWWVLAVIVVPLNLMGELVRGVLAPTSVDAAQVGNFGIYFVVVMLVSIAASIATIQYIHATVQSSRLSVTQTWLLAANNFPGYLVLSLLSVLAVVAGLVAFIVPGIVVLVRISLAPYVFLLEKRSAKESIKHSWELTRGHFGTLFLGTIVLAIPGILFSFLITSSSDLTASNVQVAIISSIEMWLGVLFTVFYFRVYTYLNSQR
ncbi:MAG TPA: hypothetical protein DE045_07180 [Oceanospirillaceae bacterium]|mgnify:CR=1 FL=1|nr:hypothetical protein [Oceanospirillaceae bacterium]